MTAENDELLIDRLYRMTFGKPVADWRSNKAMRQALTEARRFVLDERMSGFVPDLELACLNRGRAISHSGVSRAFRTMRMSARSPHQTVWLEIDMLSFRARARQLYAYATNENDVSRQGWLIGFDPKDPEFSAATLFRALRDGSIQWSPNCIAWRTDDKDIGVDNWLSEDDALFLIGLADHPDWGADEQHSAYCDILRGHVGGFSCLQLFKPSKRSLITQGEFRVLWALLSTIDDLPIIYQSPTRVAKGFMARAQYRRLLEHKVITLNVPHVEDPRKLARKVVADAKRRAHMVRGHWRKDFYHPLTPFCAHDFEPAGQHLICRHCRGHKIWISEHHRGDVSLGFVVHDYAVTHEQQKIEGAR